MRRGRSERVAGVAVAADEAAVVADAEATVEAEGVEEGEETVAVGAEGAGGTTKLKWFQAVLLCGAGLRRRGIPSIAIVRL